MESDIVFAHELIELHILLILPPLSPLISVISSDRDVANRCIEPDIENLVRELIERDRCSPFEITCNAASMKTFIKQSSSESL